MQINKSTTNQSVYSALEIISYMSGRGWCKVKDISIDLGIDTAKVHRILYSMIQLNYVEYDKANHRYRLGMALFSVVYHMTKGDSMLSIIRQPLEQLAKKTGHNINFFILSDIDHSKIINILRLENDDPISKFEEGIGESENIYTTAGGKCLMAYLPLDEQKTIAQNLSYKKLTNATIMTPQRLLEELETIRERGIAFDREEFHENVFCIAMPIFNSIGDIYGAISISASRPLEPNLNYYRFAIQDTIESLQRNNLPHR